MIKKRTGAFYKFTAVFLTLALIVTSININFSNIYAADQNNALYAEFTNIKYTDINNQPLQEPLAQDAAVKMTFDWHVVDYTSNVGTTTSSAITTGGAITTTSSALTLAPLTYTFPDIVDLGKQDVAGILDDGLGGSYGSYTLDVSERKLILTFNERAKSESNVKGTVIFNRKFSLVNQSVTVPYTMRVKINENITKTFVLGFTPKGVSDISKIADSEKVGRDKKVNYAIDINTRLNATTGSAIISDTLDKLLQYDTASFKLYELALKSDGNHTIIGQDLYDTRDMQFSVDSNNQPTFNYHFNTFENKAYRLIYTAFINETVLDTSVAHYDNIVNTAMYEGKSSSVKVSYTPEHMFTKEGTPDKQFNGTHIQWILEINKPGYTLSDVSLKDTLPAKLTLVDLKVLDTDNQPYLNYINQSTGSAIALNFNTISQPLKIMYTTSVNADVLLSKDTTFDYNNKAQLNYVEASGEPKTLDKNKTVTMTFGGVLGKKIVKDVIDYGTQKYLLWNVIVNKGEDNLGKVYLKDKLTTGHHYFKPEHLEVKEVILDDVGNMSLGSTLQAGQDYKVYFAKDEGDQTRNPDQEHGAYTSASTSEPNYMEVEFLTKVEKPYMVSYRTYVKQNSDGTYDDNYTNDAVLWYSPWRSGEGSGDNGSRVWHSMLLTDPVTSHPEIKNNGFKYIYNYKNSINPWQINADSSSQNFNYNPDGTVTSRWLLKATLYEKPAQALTFNDTFGNGFYMSNDQYDSILIKKSTTDYNAAKTVSEKYIKQKILNSKGQIIGFNIIFNEEAKNAGYYVDYETTVNKDSLSDYTTVPVSYVDYNNTFKLSAGDNVLMDTVSAKPYINHKVKREGFKSAEWKDVNKKESLVWRVYLNYLNKGIKSDYSVKDAIIGNQVLVGNIDNIVVFRYTLNKDGSIHTRVPIKDLSQVGIALSIEKNKENKDVLHIYFKKECNERYGFEYMTKREGLAQRVYQNTALTQDGETYSASMRYVPDSTPLYINKKDVGGIKYDTFKMTNYIDWQVDINDNDSTIDTLRLTDILSGGLSIDEATIEIKNKEGISFKDYFAFTEINTTEDGKKQYTFTLKNGMRLKEALKLTYRTYINSDLLLDIFNGMANLENSIVFDGSYLKQRAQTENATKKIVFFTSSGMGSGETGSFKLIKRDKETNEPLNGVVYHLYKNAVHIATLTTSNINGEAGIILQKRLKYGEYTLKEVKARDDYLMPDTQDTIHFTLDKTTPNQDHLVAYNQRKPRIKVLKVDSDATDVMLMGATFKVYRLIGGQRQYLQTLITNKEGIAITHYLSEGEYELEEIKAPTGYHLSGGSKKVTVNAQSRSLITLTFANEKQRAIRIRKVAKRSTAKDPIGLSGATFDVFNASGLKLNNAPLVTDKDGYTTLSNLKKGHYKVVETRAPLGYYDDVLAGHNIEVDASKDTFDIVVKNELKRGIKVYKVSDSNPDKGLSGAVFGLYSKQDVLIKRFLPTDKDGYTQLKDIAQGEYIIKEEQAPLSHYKSAKKWHIKIDDSSPAFTQVNITNEMMRGVRIIKVDHDDNHQFLSKARFKMTNQRGESVTLETNQYGVIDKVLKQGEYKLTEVQAPEGYFLDSQSRVFKIDTTVNQTLEIKVPNEKRRTIQIKKVDDKRPERALGGAIFEVTDAQGNIVSNRLITGEDGYAELNNLKKGRYYIRETKAPSGYYLSKEVYSVDVDASQSIFSIVVVNTQVHYSDISTPNPDKDIVKIPVVDKPKPEVTEGKSDKGSGTTIDDNGIALGNPDQPVEEEIPPRDDSVILDGGGGVPLGGELPQTDDVGSIFKLIGIGLFILGGYLLIKNWKTLK